MAKSYTGAQDRAPGLGGKVRGGAERRESEPASLPACTPSGPGACLPLWPGSRPPPRCSSRSKPFRPLKVTRGMSHTLPASGPFPTSSLYLSLTPSSSPTSTWETLLVPQLSPVVLSGTPGPSENPSSGLLGHGLTPAETLAFHPLPNWFISPGGLLASQALSSIVPGP